ncbi:MarR family winged helix-turn-helix transcriptional regulator [Aeromicrobium sp.]|uniref:MarR family winged helix-turn-helix transcriptional regulator n=1 Tax=Aeromicrobium sp. TaxID=1871063 RepID=UPI002FCA4742
MSAEVVTEEPVETSLLYLLKQVELAVRGRVDAAAAELGLTMPKFVAMSVLARHPGMTAADLARRSFVRPQSMAAVVTSLESLGFVSRSQDPADRRNHRLTLTTEGRRLVVELSLLVREIEEMMLADFTEAERMMLRDFLVRGRKALPHEFRGGL